MMRKQRKLAGQVGGAGVQGEEKKRRREEKRKGEREEGTGKGRETLKQPQERERRSGRERETGPKAASVCDDTSVLPPVPTNLCLYYKLPFQTKAESRT